MKKLMAIVVVVIMCFAIAGCGGAPSNQKVEVAMFGNYGTYDDLAPYVNAPTVKKQWNVDVRPALDVALCKVAEDAGFPGSVHYVLVDT